MDGEWTVGKEANKKKKKASIVETETYKEESLSSSNEDVIYLLNAQSNKDRDRAENADVTVQSFGNLLNLNVVENERIGATTILK